MTRMIGYLRCALIRRDEVLRIEQQMRQAALSAGAPLDAELRKEPAPQLNPLWTLMQRLDQQHHTDLISTVTDLAGREHIDLRPFRGSPATSRVLWTAIAELESTGGGYLVVPSMRHLEGFEVPRQQLMRRFAEIQPPIGVLDASTAEQVPAVTDDGDRLIGEFRVAPVPLAEEIVRLNTRTRLVQAELGDMVDAVDTVMRELVGTVTAPDHLSAQDHTLTILIHHGAGRGSLVITCLDSRDYVDTPPHPAVIAACPGGRVTRARYGSGTSTRCEMPLTTPAAAADVPFPALARR